MQGVERDIERNKAAGKRLRLLLLHVVLLWVLVFLAYGRCLQYGFAWDDFGLIVNNERIQSPESWTSFFLNSFWSVGRNVEDPARGFYRPIISISYAIDTAIWGAEAFGFHLTNLVVHMLCVALVYAFGLEILKRPWTTFLGGGVFAIHPVHVENVCWISGRTDLFCALFLLPAALAFVRWQRSHYRRDSLLLLSALFYALALLSKEMAIAFLPLILCFFLLCLPRSRRRKEPLLALALFLIVTAIYLCLRVTILGKVAAPPAFGTSWQRLISIPVVFMHYLALMFNLLPIDPHHDMPLIRTVFSPQWLPSILVCLVYAFTLWRLFMRGRRRIMLLLLWFPATLLPVMRLGSFGDVLYADRFLYIPSIGFSLAIIAMTIQTWRPDRSRGRLLAASAAYLVLTLALLSLSILHSTYWRSNLTLFQHAARTSPRSAYIQFNLGNSRYDHGEYAAAAEAYLDAIGLEPQYAQAYANLGITMNRLGEHRQALQFLKMAHEYGDAGQVTYSGMAEAQRALGNLRQAEKLYRQALELEPSAAVLNNLAECLLALGRHEEARDYFLQAYQRTPSPGVMINLGLQAYQAERFEQALQWLQMALGSRNLSVERLLPLYYNLARTHAALGETSRAADFAGRALDLCRQYPALSKEKPGMVQSLQKLAGKAFADPE